MPTVKLDAFGVVVSDMAETVRFYEQLGLVFPDNAASSRHVEITLEGGLRLMFDTEAVIRSFDEAWAPPAGGHRVNLAFLCESPAAVDAKVQQLIDAGYDCINAPWDAVWGQRYARVADPDGTPVDLFASLAHD